MTDLKSAELIKTVPSLLESEDEVKALSAAFLWLTQTLLSLEEKTDIYANKEAMSGEVCDLLGGEWRVPQYDQGYSLSVKRALIKEALVLFSNAGTKYAVKNIVETIFGSAEVDEWFDYGGEPGYFMVSTDNPGVGTSELNQFKAVAEGVKRASAWLDKVELGLKAGDMEISMGAYLREYEKVTLNIDT